MKKVVYSTDTDLLQSNLIVFDDDTCLWNDTDAGDGIVRVYKFDLLKTVDSWVNLKSINSSCGTQYLNELKKDDFINFTNDVCWYYGPINLDGSPEEMTLDNFETYIGNISL